MWDYDVSLRKSLGYYVYYTQEHYNERKKNVANSFFQESFNKGVSSARAISKKRQLAYIKQLENNSNSANEMIETIKELGKGSALQKVMNQGAQAINDLVKQYGAAGFDNFAKAKQQAYGSFFLALEDTRNGSTFTKEHINDFFNKIANAQKLVEGAHGAEAIEILRKIALGEEGFNEITEAQIIAGSKVAEYLSTAVKSGLMVGHSSAKGSNAPAANVKAIISALNNTMGKALEEQIVEDFFQDLNSQVRQVAAKGLTINTGNITTTHSGTQIENKRVFKPDIMVNNLMRYSATKLGVGNYAVDLASNVSVKWYNRADLAKGQGHVNILSKSPITTWIGEGDNSAWDNLANLIVHSTASSGDIAGLRNSLAASFMNDWLAGSGIEGNLAQYLMINGHVYSIMDIVEKVAKGYTSGWKMAAASAPIKVEFTGLTAPGKVSKRWVVDTHVQGRDKMRDMAARNQEVMKLVKDIYLTAKLNLSMVV